MQCLFRQFALQFCSLKSSCVVALFSVLTGLPFCLFYLFLGVGSDEESSDQYGAASNRSFLPLGSHPSTVIDKYIIGSEKLPGDLDRLQDLHDGSLLARATQPTHYTEHEYYAHDDKPDRWLGGRVDMGQQPSTTHIDHRDGQFQHACSTFEHC